MPCDMQYTKCLALYTAGLRVSQISSLNSRTLSLDLLWVPGQQGAKVGSCCHIPFAHGLLQK